MSYAQVLNSINTMWDGINPSLPIAYRQKFEAEKNAIQREIEQLTAKINQIKGNVDLTAEAQRRMVAEAITQAKTSIDGHMETLIQLTEQLKSELQRQLTPNRPEKIDYGELANLKADLRLVLDSKEPREAINRMAQALEEALTAGDALTTWLLAGSNWPALYLESRGITNPAEWEEVRGKVLVKHASESQLQARNLLQLLDSPKGVGGIISSLRLYANAEIDSLQR